MNMGNSIIDFNEKKGFICDMDGVIYHGNQILPGVPEFIQWLHDEKKEYLFLTNNSGYTLLSRKLNDALSSRLFYAHFDSHRDISHFKSSCFCELFF